MKMSSYFAAACLAWAAASSALAAGAFDGFRGMKWGDPVTKLGAGITPVPGAEGCYLKASEKLSINGAAITEVRYCFKDGRFTHAVVVAPYSSLSGLKTAVKAAYGKPYRETFLFTDWADDDEDGGRASMTAIESSGTLTLLFISHKAESAYARDRQEKARSDF